MAETTRLPHVATVAKVIDNCTVVINKGAQDGVRKSARFLLYGLGEEILDPESDESLGVLELVRGIGTATYVQEKMSTIKSARTRNPAPTVKTIGPRSRVALPLRDTAYDKVVEERHGEPMLVPFDGIREGDRAKPL